MTVAVDDCTGFGVGGNTLATIYDGELQETVTVTAASAQTGPGTVTLAAGLANAHPAGTVVSAFPADVIRAVALLVGSYAVDRGSMATTVQELQGSESHGGDAAATSFRVEAEMLLHPYSRVV